MVKQGKQLCSKQNDHHGRTLMSFTLTLSVVLICIMAWALPVLASPDIQWLSPQEGECLTGPFTVDHPFTSGQFDEPAAPQTDIPVRFDLLEDSGEERIVS